MVQTKRTKISLDWFLLYTQFVFQVFEHLFICTEFAVWVVSQCKNSFQQIFEVSLACRLRITFWSSISASNRFLGLSEWAIWVIPNLTMFSSCFKKLFQSCWYITGCISPCSTATSVSFAQRSKWRRKPEKWAWSSRSSAANQLSPSSWKIIFEFDFYHY